MYGVVTLFIEIGIKAHPLGIELILSKAQWKTKGMLSIENCYSKRMIAFFDATHIDMWDVVENRDHIPLHDDGTNIPRFLWNNEKKLRYFLNSKARNFMVYALT
ncbi:hypothetical protein CR513_22272, partial [Mucuna pruriens]